MIYLDILRDAIHYLTSYLVAAEIIWIVSTANHSSSFASLFTGQVGDTKSKGVIQSNLGIADLPTGKAHGHCYSAPILLEMTSDDIEGVSREKVLTSNSWGYLILSGLRGSQDWRVQGLGYFSPQSRKRTNRKHEFGDSIMFYSLGE